VSRTLRTTLLGALAAAVLTVGLPALPASAATPPAAPTSGSGTVGDRVMDLSWTGGGGTGAIVRDVTGLAAPYTATSGRAVAVASPTLAHDTGFTNTQTQTYGIWSTEDDGTPSDAPLVVDVAQAPLVSTTLTLATSVATAPWGTAVTFTSELKRAGSVPVAGVPVELYGRTGGTSDVRLLRRVTTDANGVATTAVSMSRSTDFYARFAGDAFSDASTSAHAVVRVLPRISVALSPSSILKRETSVLSGRVVPTLSGAAVYVQRLTGGTWRDLALVRTASDSSYRLSLTPDVGVYRYRARLVGTAAYLPATSAAAQLRVDYRNLVRGDSGADVLALQRVLTSLHYVPGSLNGSFGYDTQHAVMAFQKLERLPVTGMWTKAERTRSGHATAWRLRYPGTGRAVEIDITRQILVLSEKGVVKTIVDVSTGTEKPYTYKGESDIAHTPRGRYSIYYKIDGIRVSKLGELYKPSYFYKGWAIHGSASVPNYPASHGCVRITNPNADRLFPVLVKGTPVTLYDE
jgi:hypothetical protein